MRNNLQLSIMKFSFAGSYYMIIWYLKSQISLLVLKRDSWNFVNYPENIESLKHIQDFSFRIESLDTGRKLNVDKTLRRRQDRLPSTFRFLMYFPLKFCVQVDTTLKLNFIIIEALRNLVPFTSFKKHEKHPWRSVTFSKVQAQACNFT